MFFGTDIDVNNLKKSEVSKVDNCDSHGPGSQLKKQSVCDNDETGAGPEYMIDKVMIDLSMYQTELFPAHNSMLNTDVVL